MSFDINKSFKDIFLSIYGLLKNEQKYEHELQTKLKQIMVSSSNPETLKNKIVKEVAIALNASRCFFIEYDSSTNNFKKIINSYNLQRDSLSLLGFDAEKSVPNLAMKRKYLKSIVIENSEEYIKKNKLEGSPEDVFFKEYNTKASLSVRLEFNESFFGVLVVHYDVKKPFLKEFDLRILKSVVDQISTSLYLSTLYTGEKAEKEKERLLRSIISIMSANFDFEKITKKIFEILAKIYSAQNVFIDVNIDGFEKSYSYNSLTSEIKDSEGEIVNNEDMANTYARPVFNIIKNQSHYIADTHNFVVQNNLENSAIEEYFQENNIKSLLFWPLVHENSNVGKLIIHFDQTNLITAEDLDFVKSIADQLVIAIRQALNFENVNKQAQREILLRNITEKVRSSLNLDEVFSFVCEEISKLFHVGRVTIVSVPFKDNYEKYEIKKEYKTIPSVKSITELKDFSRESVFWIQTLATTKKILAFDNILECDAPDFFKNSYVSLGVKSIVGVPIKKGDELWGNLVLSDYENYRHWTEEEKNLLEIISNQVYIAINQAELYEKEKMSLKREKLIADVIANAIGTFDMNQIKPIVRDVGIMMKADRCYLVEADESGLGGKPIYYEGEYLASPEIKSIKGYEFKSEDVKKFVEMYLSTKDLIIFDYEKIRESQDEQFLGFNKYTSLFDLKSGIGIPFFYQGKLLAVLAIEYSKEKVFPTEDELDFLRILGNQAGMAFNQIKLYQDTKKAAEREKISRNIIEILRSSMDKTTIKRQFVRNIGKLFEADRVFFSEYDPVAKMYLPVDEYSEYLSSPNEKSFVGYDWSTEADGECINTLLEKRELKILCWDEYIKDNPRSPGFVALFENSGVKSSYKLPVLYQEKIMGYFSIEFTKDSCNKLSDEDINRIRSMCTQAGIALHHADLYVKVQNALRLKSEFIVSVGISVKKILDNIVEISDVMSQSEPQCEMHIKHLNRINENVNQLLDLTNSIVKNP